MLNYLGEEQVYCYCDNNKALIGTLINNKRVIDIEELVSIKDQINIIITIGLTYYEDVYKQLSLLGLQNIIINFKMGKYTFEGFYATVRQAKLDGLVIIGTGYWSKVTYKIMKMFDVLPLVFCDEYNGELFNIDIMNFTKTVKSYPNAVYVIAPDEQLDSKKRRDIITKLKINNVYSNYSELLIENYTYLLDINYEIKEKNEDKELIDYKFRYDDIDNIIVFNHMGNSGSIYFENILDSHSQILNIPFGNGINDLVYKYKYLLNRLDKKELIIEICSMMNSHFISNLNVKKMGKVTDNRCCLNKNGENDIRVLIDPTMFYKEITEQINKMKLISFSNILKGIYAAYNNVLGKQYNKHKSYWIFYHMHYVDINLEMIDNMIYTTDFKRVEYIYMIREPIQHLFSSINYHMNIGARSKAMVSSLYFINNILNNELGYRFQKESNIITPIIIRFEDVKYKFNSFINKFCSFLDISNEKSFLRTTVNGIEVYFQTIDELGNKQYITGNDTSAVKRKNYSLIISNWDEERLNIVYQKFKKAFGYKVSTKDFSNINKKQLTKMFNEPFKFVDILVEAAIESGNIEDAASIKMFIQKKFLDFMFEYDKNTIYYDYFII